MALESIIAQLRATAFGKRVIRPPDPTDDEVITRLHTTLERENQSRKRQRYQREEENLQRVRADLETGNREEWLQETLKTEDTLG